MRPAFYDDLQYKQKQSEIIHKYWQNGIYNKLVKPLEIRYCKNISCNSPFKIKPYGKKIYCSSRCAAIINNINRFRKIVFCRTCNKQLNRSNRVYCSVKCQMIYQHKILIEDWQKKSIDGNPILNTKNISRHLKRFLLEKYGEKCLACGWDNINPLTNKVPLEIDHIDGNSSNNKEGNLRLLCPNCHSLTPHFRNLNKGNGRAWRQKQSKII